MTRPDNPDEFGRIDELAPKGYMILGFVTSLKALNTEGELVLLHRVSKDITPWEGLGIATSMADDLRESLKNCDVNIDIDPDVPE